MKAELRAEGYPTDRDRIKSRTDEAKRYRILFEREFAHHEIAKGKAKNLEKKLLDVTKENMALKDENEKQERFLIALLRERGNDI